MRSQPTRLWNLPDAWSKVNARAVASGSHAQMANVLEMALQDIAALSEALNSEIAPWLEKRSLMENIRFRNAARKDPCGECHISENEICDICGAMRPERDELPNCVWANAETPFADNH